MPKIPTIQSNAMIQTPTLSPSAVSAPERAMAQAGEQIRATGIYMVKVSESIKDAQRKVKATELELDINQGFKDAALSYQTRTDFENFEKDAENSITEIETKYNDAAGDDPRLKQAMDLYFKKASSEFMNTVRMKAVQETINRGKGALESKINQTLEDYASSQSDEERKLIRTKLSGEITSYAESGIISFKEAENEIQMFDNTSEDVRADRVIEINPTEAEKMLRDGEFKLDPTKTQDKIEKAQVRQKRLEKEAKVTENEQKRKEKEAKADIDYEAGEQVSELIRDGKYNEAFSYIDKHELIDETQKLKQENRIANAAKKGKEETLDPDADAKILLHIQDPGYSRIEIRQELANALLDGKISVSSARVHYGNINDPIFQDAYFKDMNTLYRENFSWDSQTEKFLHPDGAVSYRAALYKLQEKIKEEKLVGNDIRKAGIEIALPLLKEFWVNSVFMSPEQASRNVRNLAESVGIEVPKFEPNPKPEDDIEIKEEGETRSPLSSFYK